MKRRGVKDWNVSGLYLVHTFSVSYSTDQVWRYCGGATETLRRSYGDTMDNEYVILQLSHSHGYK